MRKWGLQVVLVAACSGEAPPTSPAPVGSATVPDAARVVAADDPQPQISRCRDIAQRHRKAVENLGLAVPAELEATLERIEKRVTEQCEREKWSALTLDCFARGLTGSQIDKCVMRCGKLASADEHAGCISEIVSPPLVTGTKKVKLTETVAKPDRRVAPPPNERCAQIGARNEPLATAHQKQIGTSAAEIAKLQPVFSAFGQRIAKDCVTEEWSEDVWRCATRASSITEFNGCMPWKSAGAESE